MKPIIKNFVLQLCWLPLLLSLLIAGDYYLEMVKYQRLERAGIDAGIEALQKQVQKQDSVAHVHDMQIQLFMQDRGVEIYRLPISDSKSIYFSNTGFLEL